MGILVNPYAFAGNFGDGAISIEEYTPVNLGYGDIVVALGSGGDFDHTIREIGNVLHDPSDTGEEYKMVYSGHQGAYAGNNVYVGYAYSSDGVSWTKGGKLTLGADRASEDPYLVKSGSTYYLYVEDKEAVPFRNIRCYTSTDFSTWSDQGVVLDRTSGWEGQDVSSPVVWGEEGAWYMLYEGRGSSQDGAIGLATSSDGLSWTKDGSNPVLVGQNPTYGYAGPISWSNGVAPDDIVKVGNRYVLSFHGKRGTDGFYFRQGFATTEDLYSWADVLDDQVYMVSAPDTTTMFHVVGETLYFMYPYPGLGISQAQEGVGDAQWDNVALWVSGFGFDGETRVYDLGPLWQLDTVSGNAHIETTSPALSPASVDFDGAGDFVTYPHNSRHNFEDEEFTIKFHAVLDDISTNRCFISKYNTSGNNREYYLRYTQATSQLSFVYYSPTGGGFDFVEVGGAWAPTPGASYHIAVCRSGNTVRIFVDGSVIASADMTGVTIAPGTADVQLGVVSGGQFMDGRISGLTVYKGYGEYSGAFTAPTELAPLGPQPA